MAVFLGAPYLQLSSVLESSHGRVKLVSHGRRDVPSFSHAELLAGNRHELIQRRALLLGLSNHDGTLIPFFKEKYPSKGFQYIQYGYMVLMTFICLERGSLSLFSSAD